MKPRIPLTDKRFVYTPAVATDLRKTFARERERLQNAPSSFARVLPRPVVRAI